MADKLSNTLSDHIATIDGKLLKTFTTTHTLSFSAGTTKMPLPEYLDDRIAISVMSNGSWANFGVARYPIGTYGRWYVLRNTDYASAENVSCTVVWLIKDNVDV